MPERDQIRVVRDIQDHFQLLTEKPFTTEHLLALTEPAKLEGELFGRRYQPLGAMMVDTFIQSASTVSKLDKGERLFNRLNLMLQVNNDLTARLIQASTIGEAIFVQCIQVGAQLVYLSTLEDFVRSHEGGEGIRADLNEYFKVVRFDGANLVSTKIGNICLADFAQKPKVKDYTFSVAPYLDFLILALVYAKRGEYDKVATSNGDYPVLEYPSLTTHRIASALSGVSSLISVGRLSNVGSELDSVLPHQTIPREVREQIIDSNKSIIERVKGYMELAYQSVLNPNHPRFREVSSVLATYLSGTIDEKIFALVVLGINSYHKLRQLYRAAHGFVSKGVHPEIYQPLLSSLDDLIEAYSRVNTVLTSEYLPDILIEEDYQGLVPVFTELGKSIGEIFSKTANREYTLDLEGIDWGLFVRPQVAEIKFGSSPKQFTITLTWQNEAESLQWDLEFDCAKNLFDWSLPESPEDPKMFSARTAAFLAGEAILNLIKKKVDEQIQEKLKIQTATQSSQATSSGREERLASYSREKKLAGAKREHNEIATTVMQAFQELEAESRERKIKKAVTIPDDPQQLRELLSEIGTNDHNQVMSELIEFNEVGGKGKGFKRLSTVGSPKYEISVGGSTGGHKGIRIILLPDESSVGFQRFSIYAVWYRGNAFKAHRKRELRSF